MIERADGRGGPVPGGRVAAGEPRGGERHKARRRRAADGRHGKTEQQVEQDQGGFDRLLVYVPLRQRVQVKESGEFHRANAIRPMRIFPEQLASRASELVLTFRTSMMHEIGKAGCLIGAKAVWSMWPGYLERPG